MHIVIELLVSVAKTIEVLDALPILSSSYHLKSMKESQWFSGWPSRLLPLQGARQRIEMQTPALWRSTRSMFTDLGTPGWRRPAQEIRLWVKWPKFRCVPCVGSFDLY